MINSTERLFDQMMDMLSDLADQDFSENLNMVAAITVRDVLEKELSSDFDILRSIGRSIDLDAKTIANRASAIMSFNIIGLSVERTEELATALAKVVGKTIRNLVREDYDQESIVLFCSDMALNFEG